MKLTLPNQYDFVPRYFRLALANVLSNIMVPLANLVSIIFLGHLEKIQHLSGVALAGSLLNFLYLILIFLRMGTTGVTAQAVGRNDREGVLLIGLRNGLIALVIGMVLILLQYPLGELAFDVLNVAQEIKLSGQAYFHTQIWGSPAVLLNFVLMGWFLGLERNNLVVLLSVIGSGAKITFDYVFIIYLDWSSTGAGVSSAMSQYLLLLVGLIFLCREIQGPEVRAVVGKFWNPSAFKSTLTLNGNIFISNLAIMFTSLTFNYEGTQMGATIYTQNALLFQILSLSMYFTEGLGFGTETLVGNFKGQGSAQQLRPLAGVSVATALLVGVFFGGVCVLFPGTVFGLLTNHNEVTETINSFTPWLLLTVIFGSVGFTLDGYFLGLTEGQILRNVSLTALVVGFLPTNFTAIKFFSNDILWLSLSLFYAIRMMMLGLQLPRTFASDVKDGSISLPALEESLASPLTIKEKHQQMVVVEKLEIGQDNAG
ncbi:MAG: MATE family efflux transporter [Stigonema ocellatum SAG 48.90 = DSM 106950]|nr:MATE family efflux transporter [Stigonema ocellatum SAG 48.90 = DSM 106950]